MSKEPPDGMTYEEWQSAMIPDELGLPACSCGNGKSFAQVDGIYICYDCPDGIERFFRYDREGKKWIEDPDVFGTRAGAKTEEP